MNGVHLITEIINKMTEIAQRKAGIKYLSNLSVYRCNQRDRVAERGRGVILDQVA